LFSVTIVEVKGQHTFCCFYVLSYDLDSLVVSIRKILLPLRKTFLDQLLIYFHCKTHNVVYVYCIILPLNVQSQKMNILPDSRAQNENLIGTNNIIFMFLLLYSHLVSIYIVIIYIYIYIWSQIWTNTLSVVYFYISVYV